MTKDEINKFVSDLCKSEKFADNFSDILVKVCVYQMADTNATSFGFSSVGSSPKHPKGIQVVVKAKFL